MSVIKTIRDGILTVVSTATELGTGLSRLRGRSVVTVLKSLQSLYTWEAYYDTDLI